MNNARFDMLLNQIKATNPALAQEIATEVANLPKPVRKISLKVTEKGGLSVYGLGRFPVTLYKSQWDVLLASAKDIQEFISTNADKFVTKD